MRDYTKKYFHLNSSAVYNSSAKKGGVWRLFINFVTISKLSPICFKEFYFRVNQNAFMKSKFLQKIDKNNY